MPPAHPIILGRIGLLGLIVAPSVRQYYTYVTDTRCKRVGTQCWVFVAIMLIETVISVKFGVRIFAQTQMWNILVWLIIQVFILVGVKTNLFENCFLFIVVCLKYCMCFIVYFVGQV